MSTRSTSTVVRTTAVLGVLAALTSASAAHAVTSDVSAVTQATPALVIGASDAAQRTADEASSGAAARPAGHAFGASDAAQRSAGEGAAVVRSLDRSLPAPATTLADDGFDWASAGIGAGGGLMIAVVATLGAAALRPGRRSAGRPA